MMNILRMLPTLICLLVVLIPKSEAEDYTSGSFEASDGAKIHYIQLGSAGSHVVLIHGFTGSAEGTWTANGVAKALAADHRVVAIDCRGHGKSDKPHDPALYGGDRMAQDVIELMDHVGIERAHIHGYSMGGGITARLMAMVPGRIISAALGGSGVREVDESLAAHAASLDPEGTDPQQEEALAALRERGSRDEAAFEALRTGRSANPSTGPILDLTKIEFPVLAINGEFDRPYSKTHRMWRELEDFRNVVLPGKSHNTAVNAGYIPPAYADTLIEFFGTIDVRN